MTKFRARDLPGVPHSDATDEGQIVREDADNWFIFPGSSLIPRPGTLSTQLPKSVWEIVPEHESHTIDDITSFEATNVGIRVRFKTGPNWILKVEHPFYPENKEMVYEETPEEEKAGGG